MLSFSQYLNEVNGMGIKNAQFQNGAILGQLINGKGIRTSPVQSIVPVKKDQSGVITFSATTQSGSKYYIQLQPQQIQQWKAAKAPFQQQQQQQQNNKLPVTSVSLSKNSLIFTKQGGGWFAIDLTPQQVQQIQAQSKP